MPATMPIELRHSAERVAGNAALARLGALGWSTADILAALEETSPAECTLPARVAAACRSAFPEADADFADAVAAGMSAVAVQTVAASFALAGIRAADAFHQAERGALEPAVTA